MIGKPERDSAGDALVQGRKGLAAQTFGTVARMIVAMWLLFEAAAYFAHSFLFASVGGVFPSGPAPNLNGLDTVAALGPAAPVVHGFFAVAGLLLLLGIWSRLLMLNLMALYALMLAMAAESPGDLMLLPHMMWVLVVAGFGVILFSPRSGTS